jgi:hypothetical protein
MKFYWLKQFAAIGFLVVLAFVADLNMNKPFTINDPIIKQTILFLGIAAVLFACTQLLFNYSKVHSDFMKHPIWRRMYMIIAVWLFISFILFIIVFTLTPLGNGMQIQKWSIYIVSYYFLFFINLLVLSIVHRFFPAIRPVEKKLTVTWLASTALIAVIVFFAPSF